jgi:hypothetical protein
MSTIQNISNGEALSSVRGKINDVIDKVNDVEPTLPIPILTVLPQVDATKAGQQFWLNGEIWTYARENQFGSLEIGTPIPIKGYYEYSGVLSQQNTEAPTVSISRNNINTSVSITRASTGTYIISTDIGFKGSRKAMVSVVSKENIGNNWSIANLSFINSSGNIQEATFRTYDDNIAISDSVSGVSELNFELRIYP